MTNLKGQYYFGTLEVGITIDMTYEINVFNSDEILVDQIEMSDKSSKMKIDNEVTNRNSFWMFYMVHLSDMHTQYEPLRIHRYE